MHIFKCNTKITTYTYPAVKLILCILFIVLVLVFRFNVSIESSVWNIVFGILGAQSFILAIFCVYISIAEMLLLNERRTETENDTKFSTAEGEKYATEAILTLLLSNDILDITIRNHKTTMHLGSSSETKPGNSVFFNKRFYIGHTEYISEDQIREALISLSQGEPLCVIAIDGIPQSKEKRALRRK